MTTTITAIFASSDAALEAGERARELAGRRATVRVFLPGSKGGVLETSVLSDVGGTGKVAAFGMALGIAGALAAGLLGASFGMALVCLATGGLTGVMLGVWLTGEIYPTRILRGNAE